ncbi:dihydrofolate reductase [Candidatus Woesearchaeota archaeon]|nr:dihydrofolate reductase [Candidatus Woesearchaeota archaeon]
MRKIILFIASSLDGFIARIDQSIDWLFMDNDYGYKEFYKSIDTVLVGNKTYQKSKEFEEYPFKDKKVFVFTRSKNLKDENVDFVYDVANFSKKLIKQSGKNIWLVGGGEIVKIFLDNYLLDEIIISVHPRTPLFVGTKETKLELTNHKIFENGLVQLHYKVIR